MATRSLYIVFQTQAAHAHEVLSFREEQHLGRPAEAFVEAHLAEYIDPEEMIGTTALLAYKRDGGPEHNFRGMVEAVTVVGSSADADKSAQIVHFHVVSAIGLLSRSVGSEIFQELDVKEIVTKVLLAHGIGDDRQDWRLQGSYPKREYCVQYGESALAFVMRLLEEEGIYFRSESRDENEILVFEDDSSTAPPIEAPEQVPFRLGTGLEHEEDAVISIAERRRVVSGQFVLRDYDFKRPRFDLTATASSDIDTDLEIYDYPGLYVEPAEGKRLAAVRLEAEQAERAILRIEADCTRLLAGKKMTIVDAIHDELNGEYLVVGVTHRFGSEKNGAKPTYKATAKLIPAAVKFRSPRVTPAPIVEGPQTARVVAPEGAQSEEIHTDEHGRCKVKFHWDLGPEQADKASCWMRVGQLQTSGSMILPRIGWEVVVEFLEGNPDRPVVTGRLYNGLFMPPYALPEGKTRSSLQTSSTPGGGGRNEIRFEDRAGGEEIMIHAEYNQNIATANNKVKNVGNNESRNVKVDETVTIGANQDVKVTKGYRNTIGADQSVSIGGSRKVEVNAVTGVTVGGGSSTSVGGNHFEMDGNPLQALLALAVQKATEVAAAKAGEALGKIDAAVQSKVDQVMGPINDLQSKAQDLGKGMKSLANGNLGAAAGLLAGAAGLPGPGGFASALGTPAALNEVGGGGSSTAGITAQLGMDQAVNYAIQHGVNAAGNALGAALGLDPVGGGGSSAANVDGPEGNVDGIDGEDRAKGPGHSLNKVSGSHTETVGSARIAAALTGVMTNVAGAAAENVGAAKVVMALGNIASTAEGDKTENALGLVVVSRADETEAVTGDKTALIGGAILEKIAGGHTISAGAPATFIGAFHKIEAKTAITLRCGASEVVIDGGGVTVKSPLVMVTAGKIQMPKAVTEV